MANKRQTRAGPKCSKAVEKNSSDEDAAQKQNDETKENSKEPEAPKDPLEDEDPLKPTSRVSSPIDKESDTDSADREKRKDAEDEGANEVNGDDVVKPPEDNHEEVDPPKPDEPAKLTLRLVPLTQLLKPEVLDKPAEETKKVRRKVVPMRPRKSTTTIEISSDSGESAERISLSSSDDEVVVKKLTPRRDRDAGSSKENKSTNKKLSNGTSKFSFKEPMSPTKYMKNGQDLKVSVEKMPNNVNKLMKSYRVDQSRIESWSETDDFENMISTSKIDRNAPEKSKQEEKHSHVKDVDTARISKRTSKAKKKSDSDSPCEFEAKEEKVEKSLRRRPERKSAATSKLLTKSAIEIDKTARLSSSSSSDEDVAPLRNTRKTTEPTAGTSKSSENTKRSASLSKGKAEPTSKKLRARRKASSSDSDSSAKLFKKKKKSVKDDHDKERAGKSRRDKSTSSEEGDAAPAKQKKSAKESQQQNASKSKKGEVMERKTRSSQRKGKPVKRGGSGSSCEEGTASEAASDDEDTKKSSSSIKSSLSDDGDTKKSSSSIKSSLSDDERSLEPIKLGKSEPNRSSASETEEVASEKSAKNEHNSAASGSASERDKSEESDPDKPTILDQKFRNRNKFLSNSSFEKLKEKIEQRKSRQKLDEDSSSSAVTKRDKKKDKKISEKNNNDEESDPEEVASDSDSSSIKKAKKLAAKRKRLVSSSDEDQKRSAKAPSKKKKKMSSGDETDYEPASGDEKTRNSDDESVKNSSDEEDEKPTKRKGKDSSDYDEDDDDLEKSRPKNKRLKRIKKLASSDEEGENGEKAKGRKTIRKIIKADKLDVSTKEAAKIERERKQRIEERQKMYNQFYDERPEEAKEITKLVLDFDEKTKTPLLQVDKKLVKKLKPHQANGVKFMWDACFESLNRCQKENGSGCILAHCMGLGKTLQVITLVHTLLKNSDETGVSRVLVVCPLSTVLNWVNEFNIWLKDIDGSEDIYVYEINKLKQNQDRSNKLKEWHKDGGIMILSYDMFRNLTNETGNRFRKKIKEEFQASLVDPGPDLIICDEGHLLKNEKTSISKAMMRLRTLRRIVLTGTPLQNNLKEYYCMVQFVKPNLLGKYQEYLNRFVNPITNGQYTDSTDYDIQIMRRRAHVLHKMLDGCVQRRDYSVLAPFLPPKHEYVMQIKLQPMQVALYKYYMENKSRSNDENGGRKGSILFQDFQNLQRIWTAPLVLRYNSNRYELEMQRRRDLESEDESEGSLKDFIDDSDSAVSTSSSSSDDQSEDDAASIHSDDPKKAKKRKKKQKNVALPRRTRAKAADFPSDHEEEVAAVTKKENPTEWWMQICPEEELNNINHSSKLMLLMSILEECEQIGDKLLVFSQSLYSLDVIEHFLNYIDEQTQQNVANTSFTGSWTLGQDYFRLDGSTPVEQRNANCKHFNSPSNPRARLFLISTRAGGLGINLVAANRVIIFDVSWNPSHDIQSIFRVYRFGQKKPCYIYRFLAMGTMEEKIYERQVTKQAISKRVIDEQQIDRHYNQNDLQELYKYELEPDDERILPKLPKDRLFAEMLKKYEDMIYKYHEHDTLLENKEEETLDEEERRQAWEEFEQEKNRPQFVANYAPQQPRGIGPVTSNNIFGIRTDVLLKLLSMKARLDNRDMSDASVKQAIPLLMQELYRQMERGELTLYQQLLALSSSLEVPQNYGGQFHVNENMMYQTYNSMNAMPSTSSFQPANPLLQRQQQMAERQQQLLRFAQQQRQHMISQQMKQRKSPVVLGSVIEID